MANQTSSIEWTDATWNPLAGCTRVSQGCVHCYAETMAARIANAAQKKLRDGDPLTLTQMAYRKVVRWERGGKYAADIHDKALPKWNHEIELIPDALTHPLRWTKPRQVFVNSMTDLFHEKVPFDYIDKVFAIMALTPEHTFQVLTKRPERMVEYFDYRRDPLRKIMEAGEKLAGQHGWCHVDGISEREWPLKNVWLGTSCEDQKTADERIPHLLKIRAAVRFLSCEPLLGPVDLRNGLPGRVNPHWSGFADDSPRSDWGIDWVICGGESGPGARPMLTRYAQSLRDQCVATKTSFFFKQWGAWLPSPPELNYEQGEAWAKELTQTFQKWADGHTYANVGKHKAGRILDGRTWDEFPIGPTCPISPTEANS